MRYRPSYVGIEDAAAAKSWILSLPGKALALIGPLPRMWVEMRICLTLELIPSFRLIL